MSGRLTLQSACPLVMSCDTGSIGMLLCPLTHMLKHTQWYYPPPLAVFSIASVHLHILLVPMSLGLAYICSSVDLLILEMSTCTHLPFGLAIIISTVKQYHKCRFADIRGAMSACSPPGG